MRLTPLVTSFFCLVNSVFSQHVVERAWLIDLDILYFNDAIVNDRGLTIPHPHLHERRFALEPLSEVFPEMIHPLLKKTNKDLLASLDDGLSVFKINSEKQLMH